MVITIGFMVVLIEIPTYVYISLSALLRYLKYRYMPDLYLSVAFLTALIPSILRARVSTMQDEVLVLQLYRVINTFLMIEIFLFLAAFSLYYMNKLDMTVVFFAFLTGILAGAFLYSPSFHVIYDEPTKNWNAVYDTQLFLLIVPLIVISIIRILQPLIRKAQALHKPSDKSLIIVMAIGISLIILWGILTPFTSNIWIRNIRPLMFALGWLIWFVASQRKPFFLSISQSTPVAIFVTTPSGNLHASYEFNEGLNYEAELIVPLFQALNSMASEIFKSKGITTFNVGEYEALKISKGKFDFYLIASKLDDTMKSVFNYFTNYILPHIEHLTESDTVDINDFVESVFSQLIIKHQKIPVIQPKTALQ